MLTYLPYKTFIDNLGGSMSLSEQHEFSYTLMGSLGKPVYVFRWINNDVIDNCGGPVLYKGKPIKAKDMYNIIKSYERFSLREKKLNRVYENQER